MVSEWYRQVQEKETFWQRCNINHRYFCQCWNLKRQLRILLSSALLLLKISCQFYRLSAFSHLTHRVIGRYWSRGDFNLELRAVYLSLWDALLRRSAAPQCSPQYKGLINVKQIKFGFDSNRSQPNWSCLAKQINLTRPARTLLMEYCWYALEALDWGSKCL